MRRSKSNPAKYARNYRKISQRKMTEHEGANDEEEIERLRKLLRTSTEHLSKYSNSNDDSRRNDLDDGSSRKKRKTNHDDGRKDTNDSGDTSSAYETSKLSEGSATAMDTENDEPKNDTPKYVTDDTELMLPSSRKKIKKKKEIQLTPEELRAARLKHKAMQRKLNQIEKRHEQKKKRSVLYQTLSEHALSETEMQLMGKSSELGKRVSKKEALRKLLQKERAGVKLNEEERNALYTSAERKDEEEFESYNPPTSEDGGQAQGESDEVVPLSFASSGRKKKGKKKKRKKSLETEPDGDEEKTIHEHEEKTKSESPAQQQSKQSKAGESTKVDKSQNESSISKTKETNNEKPKTSFAAQMMAGLSSLKVVAVEKKEELDKKQAIEEAELEKERLRKEEEERKNRKVYIPENPAILKSAANMGLKTNDNNSKDAWRVLPVNRPEEVNATRYDLPVSAMEYEIIDSVRNHSVTIICSETGSGKSTQVPQFLYESGLTLGNAKKEGEDDGLLICVTQPRRVAAVSTAKRVCYEMGHSKDKGQTIQGKRGEGNTVAYQTKYETAGLGPSTRVKFMTDGILLQEIKSDLLLRKYAGEYVL